MVQVGFLWGDFNHRFPLNFVFGNNSGQEVRINSYRSEIDPADAASVIINPYRITICDGGLQPQKTQIAHYPVSRKSDLFAVLNERCRTFCEEVMIVAADSDIPIDQWGDLVSGRGILIEFRAPLTQDIIKWLYDRSNTSPGSPTEISKLLIIPEERAGKQAIFLYVLSNNRIVRVLSPSANYYDMQKLISDGLHTLSGDTKEPGGAPEPELYEYYENEDVVSEEYPYGEAGELEGAGATAGGGGAGGAGGTGGATETGGTGGPAGDGGATGTGGAGEAVDAGGTGSASGAGGEEAIGNAGGIRASDEGLSGRDSSADGSVDNEGVDADEGGNDGDGDGVPGEEDGGGISGNMAEGFSERRTANSVSSSGSNVLGNVLSAAQEGEANSIQTDYAVAYTPQIEAEKMNIETGAASGKLGASGTNNNTQTEPEQPGTDAGNIRYMTINEVGGGRFPAFSPDVFCIVEGPKTYDFRRIRYTAPTDVRDKSELENIILASDIYSYNRSIDYNDTLVFKNMTSIYRLYKDGFMEYNYIPLTQPGEKGSLTAALENAVAYILNIERSLLGSADMILSGISENDTGLTYRFTFDYIIDDYPVYFRYEQMQGDSITEYRNAITIDANANRVVSCRWMLVDLFFATDTKKLQIYFDKIEVDQNLTKMDVSDIAIAYNIDMTIEQNSRGGLYSNAYYEWPVWAITAPDGTVDTVKLSEG